MRFAPGLYAILDLGVIGAREPFAVAEALLRGGCVALQLRVKDPASALPLVPLGRTLAEVAERWGVPFIVNDDPDLARACGAKGVHLGQTDRTPDEARAILGASGIIGLSTHTLAQARAAVGCGVDYLGFGPILPTATKRAADPAQGFEGLRLVCLAATLPVVAIGGLGEEHAARVASAGAAAGAAISSVLNAPDVEGAARSFGEAFRRGLPSR